MRKVISVTLACLLLASPAMAQTAPTIQSLQAQVNAAIAARGAAYNPPPKSDDDPSAWARMMGTDPQYQQEQADTRATVGAYTNAEMNRNFQKAVAMDAATSQMERDTIVRTIEQVYAQKLNVASFTVQQASYFPQGANYVICGTAIFWRGTTSYRGTFIFNSRTNGDKIVNATQVQAQVNGCFSPAQFPLTQ